MFALIQKIEEKYKKPQIVDVRSGDTVRVHQRIKEGAKTRVQIFEGLVIRTRRMGSLSASILVRRIASGVGVEKGILLHSPVIEKVEVIKRAKVRRNYLSYMRQRGGKAARLSGVDFDREKVNKANAPVIVEEPAVPADTGKEAKEAEKALADAEPAAPAAEPTGADTPAPVAATPEPAETKEVKEPSDKAEKPAEAETAKEDKAKAKKEKAEAFRKAQEAKTK
jgi:large subunit ribosomal protein L19